MRFYLSYFKLRFITQLQYRKAALAGITTQFFFGLVYIMVYLAFYESSSNNGPMEVGQLVSYLWLNQAFFALIYMYYKDNEIFNMIKNGNIAYELLRPKKIYFMGFSKIIGQRLADVALRFLPVLIVAFILPYPYGLSLPSSFLSLIMFLITLTIGALLMTAIITLYHVLTLSTLNEKGITNIFMALADILSGGVIPIPFFPVFLQKIANVLPFRYICDLPFRLYSGNISVSDGLFQMLIQVIWFIILVLIGNVILKKILKKVVVQGG